jgi:hypothetical protein
MMISSTDMHLDFRCGGLENLRRCGLRPAQVIDIGAFIGDWTQKMRTIWPEAKYLMIEHQPLNIICIVACAELSYFLVERPSFRLRDRLERELWSARLFSVKAAEVRAG